MELKNTNRFTNNRVYDWKIFNIDSILSDEEKELLSPIEKKELKEFLIKKIKNKGKFKKEDINVDTLKMHAHFWLYENRTVDKIINDMKSSCDKNKVVESSYMNNETLASVINDEGFRNYAESNKKIIMVRKIKMISNNQNNGNNTNNVNYKYSITLIDKDNPQLPENFDITRKTSLHIYSHGAEAYSLVLSEKGNYFLDYIKADKLKTYFTVDGINGFINECANLKNVSDILSKIENLKLDSDEEIFIYPYNEKEKRTNIIKPDESTVKKNARNVARLISKILEKDNENSEHKIEDKHGIYFLGNSYGNYLNNMTNEYLANINEKSKYVQNAKALKNRIPEIHMKSLGITGSSKNRLWDGAKNIFINYPFFFSQSRTVDTLTKLGNRGHKITCAKRELKGFCHSSAGMKRIINKANTGIKDQNNKIKIGFFNMIDKDFENIDIEYDDIKTGEVKEYGIKDKGYCFSSNRNGSTFFGKQLFDKNQQTLNGIFVFENKQQAFIGDFIKNDEYSIIPLKGILRNSLYNDKHIKMKLVKENINGGNGWDLLKGNITFKNGTLFKGSLHPLAFDKSKGEYVFDKIEGEFHLPSGIDINVKYNQGYSRNIFSTCKYDGTITFENGEKFEGTFKFDPSNNKIEFIDGTLKLKNKKENKKELYNITVKEGKIKNIKAYVKENNEQQNVICANISDELLLCCSGNNEDKEYFIFLLNKDSIEFEKQIITKEQYMQIKNVMNKLDNKYDKLLEKKIYNNINSIDILYNKDNYITTQEAQKFIDDETEEVKKQFTKNYYSIYYKKLQQIQQLGEIIKEEEISNKKFFIKWKEQLDILKKNEINKLKGFSNKIYYDFEIKKYKQSIRRIINEIEKSNIGYIFVSKKQERLNNHNNERNSYYYNINLGFGINRQDYNINLGFGINRQDYNINWEFERKMLLNKYSQIKKDIGMASRIHNSSSTVSTQENQKDFEEFKKNITLSLECIKETIEEIDKKIEEITYLDLSGENDGLKEINDKMEEYKKKYSNSLKEENKSENIMKDSKMDKISIKSEKLLSPILCNSKSSLNRTDKISIKSEGGIRNKINNKMEEYKNNKNPKEEEEDSKTIIKKNDKIDKMSIKSAKIFSPALLHHKKALNETNKISTEFIKSKGRINNIDNDNIIQTKKNTTEKLEKINSEMDKISETSIKSIKSAKSETIYNPAGKDNIIII